MYVVVKIKHNYAQQAENMKTKAVKRQRLRCNRADLCVSLSVNGRYMCRLLSPSENMPIFLLCTKEYTTIGSGRNTFTQLCALGGPPNYEL